MQSQEAATFWRYIAGSLDRLIGMLAGMEESELNWRPAAPDTNTLYVLATHTMANAEENILGTLCGQSVRRERADEFAARGATSEPLQARWRDLRDRLELALASLPSSELDAVRVHPRRGALQGRDILIVVARHAAEHLGQAELTRDLMKAVSGRGSRSAEEPDGG